MNNIGTTDRLYFKKYRGRLVSDILIIDPKYLKFLKEQKLVTFNDYLTKILS